MTVVRKCFLDIFLTRSGNFCVDLVCLKASTGCRTYIILKARVVCLPSAFCFVHGLIVRHGFDSSLGYLGKGGILEKYMVWHCREVHCMANLTFITYSLHRLTKASKIKWSTPGIILQIQRVAVTDDIYSCLILFLVRGYINAFGNWQINDENGKTACSTYKNHTQQSRYILLCGEQQAKLQPALWS